MKFVLREQRRGRFYEGILMDPPSYGRGPDGEMWRIEANLYPLVRECVSLLSPDAGFFLINSYTTGVTTGATSSRARPPRWMATPSSEPVRHSSSNSNAEKEKIPGSVSGQVRQKRSKVLSQKRQPHMGAAFSFQTRAGSRFLPCDQSKSGSVTGKRSFGRCSRRMISFIARTTSGCSAATSWSSCRSVARS